MEIFGRYRTVPDRNGKLDTRCMYFFPDSCFYEFITEKDMEELEEHPDFIPQTLLMNEVLRAKNMSWC